MLYFCHGAVGVGESLSRICTTHNAVVTAKIFKYSIIYRTNISILQYGHIK